MSSGVVARRGKARRIPIHRAVPALVRDPLGALRTMARDADGAIVRLDLGLFRPYLVTNPDHVQHILRDRHSDYVREGMFWSPLRRLLGEGILADGQRWEWSRHILQPQLTAKRVDALMDRMSAAVNEAVAGLDQYAGSGQSIDVNTEMSRIVNQTVIKVFFGDRIPVRQADGIIPALNIIARSFVLRMIFPFVPTAVPMPGDRAFRRGVQIIDDVLMPPIHAFRAAPDDGDDIIATLCRARDAHGRPFTERQIRDDVVAMFVTATETTSLALTWLWPIVGTHSDVATRLYDEVDRVVGGEAVMRSHVAELHYTRAVLDELLRLYPTGWIFPRTATVPDVIGGVSIKPGATMLISPYLTQRMDLYWERPDIFDPDRFSGDRAALRHRYAYFPFGGGPHQCLGRHVFQVEAQLIVASMLARFRLEFTDPEVPPPHLAATLLPVRRTRMTLRPVQRRIAA